MGAGGQAVRRAGATTAGRVRLPWTTSACWRCSTTPSPPCVQRWTHSRTGARRAGKPGQYRLDLAADGAALPVLHGAGLAVLSEESGVDRRRALRAAGGDRPGRRLHQRAPGRALLRDEHLRARRRGPRVGVVVNLATGERYAAVRGGGAEKDGQAHRAVGLRGPAERHRGHLGLPGPPPGLGPVPGARRGLARVLRGGRGGARRLHGGRGAAPSTVGTTWPACSICREVGVVEGERDGRDLVVRDASSRRPIVAATPALAARLAAEERPVSDGSGECSGALRARKTWRTLEPLHGMIYFVPEAAEAYARLGITGRAGYFASRAAPMGAVHGRRRRLDLLQLQPRAGARGDPRVLGGGDARAAGRRPASPRSTQRSGGSWAMRSSTSEEMRRAADLARTAAEAGGRAGSEGRPLAAAHADVAWPDRAAPGAVARPVDPARVPGRRTRRAARGARPVGHRGTGHPRGRRRRAGARPALDAGLARRGVGRRRSMRCAGGAGSRRATSSASPSGARPSAGRSRTAPTRWRRRPTPCWARTLRRAARPGPALEQSPRRTAAPLRAPWRVVGPGWA